MVKLYVRGFAIHDNFVIVAFSYFLHFHIHLKDHFSNPRSMQLGPRATLSFVNIPFWLNSKLVLPCLKNLQYPPLLSDVQFCQFLWLFIIFCSKNYETTSVSSNKNQAVLWYLKMYRFLCKRFLWPFQISTKVTWAKRN